MACLQEVASKVLCRRHLTSLTEIAFLVTFTSIVYVYQHLVPTGFLKQKEKNAQDIVLAVWEIICSSVMHLRGLCLRPVKESKNLYGSNGGWHLPFQQ